MTRADERRAKEAIRQAEFDAMLADFDTANSNADTLDAAARSNADAEKGAVQALLAVSNRLDALGIIIRYVTEKQGPLA